MYTMINVTTALKIRIGNSVLQYFSSFSSKYIHIIINGKHRSIPITGLMNPANTAFTMT